VHESTWTVRLAAPVMLLMLTACGTHTTAQPQAAPATLPANQLVFMVESGGGYVTAVNAALESPHLAVYGDGRIIRFDDRRDGYEVPAGYTVAHVDPLVVFRFAAETEALRLIEEGTDFGSPPVSDMPYTTVLLHGAGGPQVIAVYAFEHFDSDVSPAEREARRQLSQVIERARALPGDGAWTTYRPDQVRVFAWHGDGDPDDPPAWPGPTPDSFLRPSQQFEACGTLSGSAAATVYTAARGNPGAVWRVGGTLRTLAVTALLPGTTGCRT
jgi:hypothetical protein